MRCAPNMTAESAAVAAKPQMRMLAISAAVCVRAMASGGLLLEECGGGGDEAHVGEGLREVAHGLAGARADLLGEEADVVRVLAELLEELLRLVVVAGVREVFGRPEIARRERVLRRGEAVVAGVVAVAVDQPVVAQDLRDVAVRSLHARMPGLAIAVAREEQQARIGLLAAVVRDVAA